MEPLTIGMIGGVLLVLAIATGVGQMLNRQESTGINPGVVRNFNLRIRAWWLMLTVLGAAFFLGNTMTVVLFGLLSFMALREFITVTPTRLGDHRALFWVFFVFTPLQFVLVGMQDYALYSIVIPVYAFLFIPMRAAFAGDNRRFLERVAKIQTGLLICVYCLSYAPAILGLPLAGHTEPVVTVPDSVPDSEGPAAVSALKGPLGNSPEELERERRNQNARLLFFFIVVVQAADLFQYAWGKLIGRTVIAPRINASRTWEGFFGGVGTATLLGTALYWATPFEPWVAAGLSAVIAVFGFGGGMTMSAIKRDRGVKDYGTLVEGHSGVLDRIDSICFAAPVFFHLARWCLG
ncbi:MAG: phosphatidate cytidylyltransferase [Pirellulales bacterium]|nr:phosphatidate cytidylyltransferase [Pirellulales bacterium]